MRRNIILPAASAVVVLTAVLIWQVLTASSSHIRLSRTNIRSGHWPTLNIQQFVKSRRVASCQSGLVAVRDIHLPLSVTHPPGRKIPKVVHVSSKSRCVTPALAKHLQQWQIPGYAFYFHDDDAVEKLFDLDWSNHFPSFHDVRKCITSGATKSDVWRYLLMWQFGGIYSDVDNGRRLFNESTILDEDDSFFTVERIGTMSQYFMASSPGHPLFKHTMRQALDKLEATVDVQANNPAKNTGPGALKNGFINFMKAGGETTNGYINASIYVGDENRKVTVVGRKWKYSTEFVDRDGFLGKLAYYKAVNIRHFLDERNEYLNSKSRIERLNTRISCRQHISNSRRDTESLRPVGTMGTISSWNISRVPDEALNDSHT